MVNRANETIRLTGSPSVQVRFIFPLELLATDIQNIAFTDSISLQIYNALPWLGKWFSSRRVMKNTVQNQADISKMTQCLKHTLVPEVCRGFVDAFLIRQQTLEVCHLVLKLSSYMQDLNLSSSQEIVNALKRYTMYSTTT